MYNRNYSFASQRLERDVATGQTIDREGVCLVAVLENGVEKVQKSAGAANEDFVGFAGLDDQAYATEPLIEEHEVPSASPFEMQLSSSTPVGTAPNVEAAVYNVTDAVWLDTQVATAGAVDAANKFHISATGMLTVYNTLAGKTMRVQWRVNLTVEEATTRYWQTTPNNMASSFFGNISVLSGRGEMWTAEYDAAVDWSDAAVVPTTGADGKVVNGGSGTACGTVVHVPTAAKPYLGLRFAVPT